MKKVLLGVIIGIVIMIPVSAVAVGGPQPFSNKIYNVPYDDMSVSVFDDADNKCYVAVGNSEFGKWDGQKSLSISCVKR